MGFFVSFFVCLLLLLLLVLGCFWFLLLVLFLLFFVAVAFVVFNKGKLCSSFTLCPQRYELNRLFCEGVKSFMLLTLTLQLNWEKEY